MERTVSDFFKNELTDFSSYSTIRMLSSGIDGLKNAQRKIIWTALKKLNSEIKVSQLDSRMQEFTQYLHGSAAGVIINLASSYVGSNNIPLIKGNGNFGSRFINEAAAPRYIYVENQKYISKIFDIQDVLIEQTFEGDKIEPKFLIPSIPLILVNGSMNCLASGFKQHILPRNIKEIYNYYSGKKCDLNPYFKDYKGIITKNSDNQWTISGIIERVGKKIFITELPVFYEYTKYLKILDDLVDSKKIKDYIDHSDVKLQKYKFEIKLFNDLKDDKLLDLLKLNSKEFEIYNIIDENNKVKTLNSVQEILDYFKEIRIKFMELQRIHDLNIKNENLKMLNSKYKFVLMIIENKLNVFKRAKNDIKDDLRKTDLEVLDDYEYLLKMPIHSFTKETLEILKNQINEINTEIKILENQNNSEKFLSDFSKILKEIQI
jgi:possible DNA topoisomerase (medium subunit) (dna topoisomerase medium subunit (Ec 5.99.1.3))